MTDENPQAPDEQPEATEPEAAPEAQAPAEPEATEPEAEAPAEPEATEPEAEAPAAPEIAEPEAPAEPEAEAPAEPAPAKSSDAPKKKDVAPGADLEPIRLETERELSAEERARLEAEEEERARREAEATADGEEPIEQRTPTVALSADTRVQATGKRKTSVARVIVSAGGGEIQVNRRDLDEYFPRSLHRTVARQALTASGYEGQVDVSVRVHGGGISGQAEAVRHGIARALTEIDPELRGELKRRGMLTRDARAVERKKAGLKKARKRPQFSKR